MTEETASNETSAACKAASTNDVIDVAVIGAGPAGLTAGLYAARAGLNVVLFERISPGGQLAQTEHMENYPGFPEGTGGFELAFAMKQQADRFGASNVGEEVVSVDFTQNPKVLTTAFNEYRAKSVIIATGARPRKLGLELEEDLQGRGVSYCATCDGNFFRDQVVAVVGGGNSALEEALYLSRIASKLYLIHRREGFRAAKVYQDKIRAASDKIELVLDTVVTGLMGEDSLQGLHLKNVKTGEETQLPVDGMFVFVGYEPQNSFLPAGLELDPQGFIITDCEMRTNLPGLFAAGDIRSKMCRQVTTAVGDGATAATAAFTYLEQLDA